MSSSNPATVTGSSALFRVEMRDDVALAVLDMPGRTMNVFSWALMDELEALIENVERNASIEALVITSGKDSFLAGADLEMVRGFTQAGRAATREHLHQMCGRLGRMFLRLEGLQKPCVAAVNGLALGGGLELAMACHYRVVADDPRLLLGLPEIKLGLLPGAGGTQRLPRLIGFEKGMELLLSGRSVGPEQARSLGLMDEIAPRARLLQHAITAARKLTTKPTGSRLAPRLDQGSFDFKAPDAVRRITRHFGIADDVVAKYPAYVAIVRSTIEGANLTIAEGTGVEMDRFVDLMRDDVAGNMVVSLFLERQKADKLVQNLFGFASPRYAVPGPGKASGNLLAALGFAKAVTIDAASATKDDILILAEGEATAETITLVEDGGSTIRHGVGVFVRRSRDYGTAIEIIAPRKASELVDKTLALARQLRATPYLHQGTKSLLATLTDIEARGAASGVAADTVMVAQALAAQKLMNDEDIGDAAAGDVACVVSGAFPAYTGGPFTFLSRHDHNAIATLRAKHQRRAPFLFA